MKKLLITLAVVGLLTTGCKTVLSPAIVRLGVATSTSYALVKYPQAVPEVRIAKEVICSAANGTNLSPTNIIAQISAINPISPETVLIVNGSLMLYIGIWQAYGVDAVNQSPVLKTYLQATCDGLSDALPAQIPRAVSVNPDWPLVRFK